VWVYTVGFHVVAVEDPTFGWFDVDPTIILYALLVVVAAKLSVRKIPGGSLSSSEFLSYSIGFRELLRTSELQIVGIFDDVDGFWLLWWSVHWRCLLRLLPAVHLLFRRWSGSIGQNLLRWSYNGLRFVRGSRRLFSMAATEILAELRVEPYLTQSLYL